MDISQPSQREIDALAARDPLLGAAISRVPPFPGIPSTYRRMSRFQALARTIVYQQLAGTAASAIWRRVLAAAGGRLTSAGVLALPPETLAGAGLSKSKLRAIRELATHVESGRLRLRSLSGLPDDEVIEELTRVWGIGNWSAQVFLMFKLGRPDVIPAGDLGIREGLRRLDGLDARPTPREVEERAERWRPLRSVASWVLWRLSDD